MIPEEDLRISFLRQGNRPLMYTITWIPMAIEFTTDDKAKGIEYLNELQRLLEKKDEAV